MKPRFWTTLLALTMSLASSTPYGQETQGPVLEATIVVGHPGGRMALDERRGVIYVNRNGPVEIRDRQTFQLIESFSGGLTAGDYQTITLDPTGQFLYVPDDYMLVYDADTHNFLYYLNIGCSIDLLVNESTGHLYCHNDGSGSGHGTLWAMDPAQPDLERVTLTTDVAAVAINPKTNLVYTVDTCDGAGSTNLTVNVLDAAPASPTFHSIVTTISGAPLDGVFGCQSAGAAVNVRTDRIFVALDNGMVHAIDGDRSSPAFHTVVATTSIGAGSPAYICGPLVPPAGCTIPVPVSVAANPVTNRVYVLQAGPWAPHPLDGTVVSPTLRFTTLDGTTLAVVSTLNLGPTSGKFIGPSGARLMMLDPSANRIFLASADILSGDPIHILRDEPAQTAQVPVDTETISTPAVDVTFSEVTASGALEVEPIDQTELPLNLPGQFAIEGGLAYDISTTATVSGPMTLCFNVAHITDPLLFNTLRVLHGENGTWVDRTASRDFATGTICATTQTLSPFVIGRMDVVYTVNKLYDDSRAVRAGSTVPLKLQLFGPGGENLSSPFVTVRAGELRMVSSSATSVVQDAGQSNADLQFRYDPNLQGGGYVFNLKTTGLATGTYELLFTATGDKTQHILSFQVR